MLKFIYYYLRSMRLYYGFITGTTTLIGCLASGHTLTEWRTWLLFVMGFLAWGFNQIFSDWCDRHEDAINAPHRPMVTGALKPAPAFAVSLVGLGAIAIIGFLLSPWTLVFLGGGGLLNICYSLLKRVPILNCLVYACAITCCALFGYIGAIGGSLALSEQLICTIISMLIQVIPVHFLMCHNSYYKDVEGDRATGIRTLQTLSYSLAFLVSILFMAGEVVLLAVMTIIFSPMILPVFVIVLVLTILYFVALSESRFHQATNYNCQLCVAMLHLMYLKQSWPVCLASLVIINLLFLWYRDEKE